MSLKGIEVFEIEATGLVTHRIAGTFEVRARTEDEARVMFDECDIDHELRFELVEGPIIIEDLDSPDWKTDD